MSFRAEVRQDAAGAVMYLGGEINALAEAAFEAAVARALGAAPGDLTLDFGETTYINSTGIALIVGLLARARDARLLVTARGLDAHQRHLFEITRLSDLVRLDDDGDTRMPTGEPAHE